MSPQPTAAGPAIDETASVIDETAQPASITSPSPATLGPPYDPTKDREIARRRLAYGLISILAFIAGALVIGVFVNSLNLTEAKELGGVVLSPIVVLVGTALGFYFGGGQHGP